MNHNKAHFLAYVVAYVVAAWQLHRMIGDIFYTGMGDGLTRLNRKQCTTLRNVNKPVCD